MKLIEIIRGANTTDETFKVIYDLSVEIGMLFLKRIPYYDKFGLRKEIISVPQSL